MEWSEYDDPKISYRTGLLQNLNQCRKEDLFTDITLRVAGAEMRCHKVVLTATSPYFRSMFTSGMKESHAQEVELKGVDAENFALLLDFAYTGQIEVTLDNVKVLMELSDMYQFTKLTKKCERFIKNTKCTTRDWANLFIASQSCGKPNRALFRDLISFLEDFLSVMVTQLKEKELLLLTEDMMFHVVRGIKINRHSDIDVEDMVYQLLAKWTKADSRNRSESFKKLVKEVRLAYCTPEFLCDVVTKDALMASPECQKLIGVAKSFQLQPYRQHEIVYRITKPRKGHPDREKRTLLVVGGYTTDTDIEIVAYKADDDGSVFEFDTEFENDLFEHNMTCRNGEICMSGKSVVVTGGRTEDNQISRFCTLCTDIGYKDVPDRKYAWMADARHEHSSVMKANAVYVFGGKNDREVLQTAERITNFQKVPNPGVIPRCQCLPHMPVAVALAKAVIFGNKIYVIGGAQDMAAQIPSATVQEYDTVHEEWSLRAEMPMPTYDASALRFNDDIYVVGGSDCVCMRYTPDTDTWVLLKGPSEPHPYGAAVVWDGCILLGGGVKLLKPGDDQEQSNGIFQDGSGRHVQITSSLEKYNPKSNKWRVIEDPGPVCFCYHHCYFNVKF